MSGPDCLLGAVTPKQQTIWDAPLLPDPEGQYSGTVRVDFDIIIKPSPKGSKCKSKKQKDAKATLTFTFTQGHKQSILFVG